MQICPSQQLCCVATRKQALRKVRDHNSAVWRGRLSVRVCETKNVNICPLVLKEQRTTSPAGASRKRRSVRALIAFGDAGSSGVSVVSDSFL
jgi:hypothetical protein